MQPRDCIYNIRNQQRVRIQKMFNSSQSARDSSIKKGVRLKQASHGRNKLPIKHTKRYSSSPVIRDIQIKPQNNSHFMNLKRWKSVRR